MPQSNSMIQTIFPSRNIFVPVQADNAKRPRCGADTTEPSAGCAVLKTLTTPASVAASSLREAAAAREIKTLIGSSVERVDAGARLVDEAGSTMEEIVSSVKRVTAIMAEISTASAEQSAGIEQVNGAIGRMDEATRQNATLVEQASAAAASLSEEAATLAGVVSVFKTAQPEARSVVSAPQRGRLALPV